LSEPVFDPIEESKKKQEYKDSVIQTEKKGLMVGKATTWTLNSAKRENVDRWDAKTKTKSTVLMYKYTFILADPLPDESVYKNESYLYLNLTECPKFIWKHNKKDEESFLDKTFLQHNFNLTGMADLIFVEYTQPYTTQKKESFKKGDTVARLLMNEGFIKIEHKELPTRTEWIPGQVQTFNIISEQNLIIGIIKNLGSPNERDILKVLKNTIPSMDEKQLFDILTAMLGDDNPRISEPKPGIFNSLI